MHAARNVIRKLEEVDSHLTRELAASVFGLPGPLHTRRLSLSQANSHTRP
jgi:hypothetical protein